MNKYKKLGGLYLVVNPVIPNVLSKIEPVLEAGVDVIQVWDNWNDSIHKVNFVNDICFIAHAYSVPVIVNNDLELLSKTQADGIHFDELPENWAAFKKTIKKPVILGITCGNDERKINAAMETPADYLSFCAMFPSTTSAVCEIVSPELVKRIRQKTDVPIFVSGGITPENTASMLALGIDGVAVISGILKNEDPRIAVKAYKRHLNIEKAVL